MWQRLFPTDLGGLTRRQFFWIAGIFWVYVTLSNIFYSGAMDLALSDDAQESLFAPWPLRLVQHALLLPVVLICYATALRVGWAPRGRAWPLQLLLGSIVAALARPALSLTMHTAMRLYHWDATKPKMIKPLFDSWFSTNSLASWGAAYLSFIIAYGFGLALLAGFSLYRTSRDRAAQVQQLESQWMRARLTALKMQLSPHTLFNLLHTIRGQIGWDPPAAQKMVVQLADLLRRLLNAGEREFVPLRDELEFSKLYLQLQQQRFADRLQIQLPDPLAIPMAQVPSLILQPLIENAVVHGLESHDKSVTISLTTAMEEDRLVISIDNEFVPNGTSLVEGIGIANVRERLEVQFQGRASLESRAVDATHWRARLTLPKLT